MTRRYYVPDLLTQQPIVRLPDDEAAHARRVMRASVDDTIECFDGAGNRAAAVITHVDRKQCVCRCERPQPDNREPSVNLQLASAVPKPERAKEMIERLTEIGVAEFQPLVFERTQRPPTESMITKWERVIIEACKQSGRNHLMTIAPVAKFSEWIVSVGLDSASRCDTLAYVTMPGAQSMTDGTTRGDQSAVNRLAIVGPEGGLTPQELDACLDRGMIAIDLGKRILRIETAAVVIAARLLID